MQDDQTRLIQNEDAPKRKPRPFVLWQFLPKLIPKFEEGVCDDELLFVTQDPSIGIYIAVYLACFGYIKMQGVGEYSPRMHPCFLLMLAAPLFLAQLTAMLALRADLIKNWGFELIPGDGMDTDESHTLRSDLLLQMKLIVIILVQCQNFYSLLSSVRKLILLVNPTSWVAIGFWETYYTEEEVENQYSSRRVLWLQKVARVFPAFIALCMRFIISYLVLVDSVSIILMSKTVKSCIFNCLALTFLLDLAAFWWQICASVFHLYPSDLSSVHPKPRTDIWVGRPGEWALSALGQAMSSMPKFTNWAVGLAPCLRPPYSYRVEHFFAKLFLLVIYVQQLFVILFAYETNVAPVARDVCTLWRFFNYEPGFAQAVDTVLFSDMVNFVNKTVMENLTASNDSNCNEGGQLYRMVNTNRKLMLWKNPVLVIVFFITVLAVFVLPHYIHVIVKRPTPDKKDEKANLEQRVDALERLLKEHGWPPRPQTSTNLANPREAVAQHDADKSGP